jgi:hypothetical protein
VAKLVVDEKEMASLEKDANLVKTLQAFMSLLEGRTQDVPHRFRCPSSFREFMSDYGTNMTWRYMTEIKGSRDACNPLMMEITTRPTQQLMEIVFASASGMRLFTLELEYGE